MCWVPTDGANVPRMSVDRDGAQTPIGAKAFVYFTPCAASRSMVGVTAYASPKQRTFGVMSSTEIQRMLGRAASWGGPAARQRARRGRKRSMLVLQRPATEGRG